MSQLFYPTVVFGFEPGENELTWAQKQSQTMGTRYQTVGELFHRSNPASGDLRNRTQKLLFKGFNFSGLPETISGLELQIKAQRNGRACDELIQLSYQDELIGKNNFNYYTDDEGHLTVRDTSVYGGPEDLWKANLTPEMLQDPSFGAVLQFQAHPYYPHRSGMFIDSVSVTIY